MALTYNQLVQAVKDYTENDETTFTNNIPIFIRQCEQRIVNSVQSPLFKKNVTGVLTVDNRFLTVPTDFLAPYEVIVSYDVTETVDDVPVTTTQTRTLLQKDVSWIREAYPDATDTGLSDYYGLFDQSCLILSRTPDIAYPVELHYYAYPESLVDAGTTNTTWLSTYFDSALLYGSLVEAYIFMKGEPDIMAKYDAQFMSALGLFKQLGDGKERMDTYRTVQVRNPVT